MQVQRIMLCVGAIVLLAAGLIVPASASISPVTLVAELAPGQSVSETKTVTIPDVPPRADVVFAFDLTGSMGDILNTAKAQAMTILNALDALPGVDTQYGIMSYMDYPHWYSSCGYSETYGYVSSGDYAYSLDQPVTGEATLVTAVIDALALGSGGDTPEGYARIMYESYADPNVGWRGGARRILINFADAVPHDCNLNENVPGYGDVWSTGGDPGRDEVMGTADDLDLQTVLAGMAANGVILLECHTTSSNSAHWAYWTGLTGGGFYLTSSGSLLDDIVAAVQDALTIPEVDGLHLEASAGFESWLVSVTPTVYDDLVTGDEVTFDLTITVPEGTASGVYNFTISALDEDGVSYGDQAVTITVLSNQPPVADPNGPYTGVPGTPIAFDGTGSTDPDGDPLTYAWGFGDGGAGAGATPTHSYTSAGIYQVCLTVDDGLAQDTACTAAVVGLSGTGFVTGGGWITSPPGAYAADPGLEGHANFGFVAMTKKGQPAPNGQTEFQFQAAGFNFHSTGYDWLAFTGDDLATFGGTGTINGAGEYHFHVWAGDGEPDTFRIKIWWLDGGNEIVVYDNGSDQALAGGSIVIHTK